MQTWQSCKFHKEWKEVAFAVLRWVFRRCRCKLWEKHHKVLQLHLPAGGIAGGSPAPASTAEGTSLGGQESGREVPALGVQGRLAWNPHSMASGELGLLPAASFLLALASLGLLLTAVPGCYLLVHISGFHHICCVCI